MNFLKKQDSIFIEIPDLLSQGYTLNHHLTCGDGKVATKQPSKTLCSSNVHIFIIITVEAEGLGDGLTLSVGVTPLFSRFFLRGA